MVLYTRPVIERWAAMVSDKLLRSDAVPNSPRLLQQVRERLRLKHYSLRTETAYVGWIKRFIMFSGKRHPADMGKVEVEAFLTSLAIERNVSASTQNQALAALLFLYREVLGIELPWLDDVTRAKKPARLPTVLTREEVAAVLRGIGDGEVALMVRLLYGTGMRLLECARLRIKDVDLNRNEIVVRDGKGGKDRVTMVPMQLASLLAAQIAHVRVVHQADLAAGRGEVWLPDALAVKYPRAATTFGWQYLFPAAGLSVDPRSGAVRRAPMPSRWSKWTAAFPRTFSPESAPCLWCGRQRRLLSRPPIST